MRIVYGVVAVIAVAATDLQQEIPVRAVSVRASSDSGAFLSVSQVRVLSDGRVLVHDATRRRIVMLDSALRMVSVIADTAAGAANAYPVPRASLLRYRGDSSVLVDMNAGALVVIEPSGRLGRVMAAPDASVLTPMSLAACVCPVDSAGRFYYWTRRRPHGPPLAPPPPADGANVPVITQIYPDSGMVIRADLVARAVDTIATLKMPPLRTGMISVQQRGLQSFSMFHPLPTTDEWTALDDGTVAVVRAQDYHIDWVDSRGTVTRSPKMPFAWKRITHEEKVELLDSLKAAYQERALRAPPRPGMATPPFVTVAPEEIADYYPPIRPNQVRADRDGNVWILPSTVTGSGEGLVYDIANRTGTLVERVKLPPGRNVIGFGPQGTMFLVHAPSSDRIVLERATIVR